LTAGADGLHTAAMSASRFLRPTARFAVVRAPMCARATVIQETSS
jgi:hypothetical protein